MSVSAGALEDALERINHVKETGQTVVLRPHFKLGGWPPTAFSTFCWSLAHWLSVDPKTIEELPDGGELISLTHGLKLRWLSREDRLLLMEAVQLDLVYGQAQLNALVINPAENRPNPA